MGIYSNGTIFGIQIYHVNDDDIDILYEAKYDSEMTFEQMREAYLFYHALNTKNNVFVKMYTECSSTLSSKTNKFMMWQPLPLPIFVEKFGV